MKKPTSESAVWRAKRNQIPMPLDADAGWADMQKLMGGNFLTEPRILAPPISAGFSYWKKLFIFVSGVGIGIALMWAVQTKKHHDVKDLVTGGVNSISRPPGSKQITGALADNQRAATFGTFRDDKGHITAPDKPALLTTDEANNKPAVPGPGLSRPSPAPMNKNSMVSARVQSTGAWATRLTGTEKIRSFLRIPGSVTSGTTSAKSLETASSLPEITTDKRLKIKTARSGLLARLKVAEFRLQQGRAQLASQLSGSGSLSRSRKHHTGLNRGLYGDDLSGKRQPLDTGTRRRNTFESVGPQSQDSSDNKKLSFNQTDNNTRLQGEDLTGNSVVSSQPSFTSKNNPVIKVHLSVPVVNQVKKITKVSDLKKKQAPDSTAFSSDWGIRLGVNNRSSFMISSENRNLYGHLPLDFYTGVYAKVHLSKRLAFKPELTILNPNLLSVRYALKHNASDTSSSKNIIVDKRKIYTLEIPLNLSYQISRRLDVQMGPVIQIPVSQLLISHSTNTTRQTAVAADSSHAASIIYTTTSKAGTGNKSDYIKRVNLSVSAGLTFHYKRLEVEATLMRTLTPFQLKSTAGLSRTFQNSCLFSLNYRIGKVRLTGKGKK